jgi:hypothetical protein
MKQFLNNLLGGWSRRRQTPRAARPRPPVRLNVETMEERLVATVSAFSAPLSTGTALVAGSAQATPGGTSNPILPEQCVHGYKWRRPRPWTADSGKPTAMAADPSLFTIVDSGPTRPAA